MKNIRGFFLFLLLSYMVLIGIQGAFQAVWAASQPIDDWVYNSQPQSPESSAPWNIPLALVGAWFALEFIRRVLMGGLMGSLVIMVLIICVLASVAGPMVTSITDQGMPRDRNYGYAVGGAKDVACFRDNLRNGKMPRPHDLTFEGLFYEYEFKTGSRAPGPEAVSTAPKGFVPLWSRAVSTHPLTGLTEEYLAVGMDSDLAFARKKLNLVVVLDISGSMDAEMNRYYYDGAGSVTARNTARGTPSGTAERLSETKLQAAAASIVALIDHLRPDDRFGMVLFDHDAYLAKSVRLVSETQMDIIKKHILELKTNGATNMEAGLTLGGSLLEPFSANDPDEFENRIIFMTDAMPNTGYVDESDLAELTTGLEKKRIHVSFVGIGLDFQTQLIEGLTKIHGANYCSVHTSDEFRKRLAEEFECMVTPMVYDLKMTLETEGVEIEKVYGSPEAARATGRLLWVRTLFPARKTSMGTKGGVILVKVRRKPGVDCARLRVAWRDRAGRDHETTAVVPMTGEDLPFHEDTGIRKAILLARYGSLVRNWLHDRQFSPGSNLTKQQDSASRQEHAASFRNRATGRGMWEQQSQPLTVKPIWADRLQTFRRHLEEEILEVGDPALSQELEVLKLLESRG